MRESRSINIGLRNVVATILIGLGLVFVWEIRGTLMLAFAAVILVILFTMPVRLLMHRFEMNRFFAIVLSVVGFFVIVTLIGGSVLPTIVRQFTDLTETVLPQAWQRAQEALDSDALITQFPFLEGAIEAIDFEINAEFVNQVVAQVTDLLGRLGGSVLPVVGGVANTLLSVLIIFFMSMYLLAEPEQYVNGIIKLTPQWYRARMRVVLRRLDSTLRAWLSVTGVSMVVVGLGTGLGLALLGIGGNAVIYPQLRTGCRASPGGGGGNRGREQHHLDRCDRIRRIILPKPGIEPGAGQRTHEYAGDSHLAWANHLWVFLWFSGTDAGSAVKRLCGCARR